MSFKQRIAAGTVALASVALVLGLVLQPSEAPVPRAGDPASPPASTVAPATGQPQASAEAPRSLGTAPAVPAKATRLGPLGADQPLALRVALRPRQAERLARLVAEISTPGSPRFRQPISSAEYRERFSPSKATRRAVARQLEAAGVEVEAVNAAGTIISARGSSAAVARVLHTSFSAYALAGRQGYAADGAPAVTGALARAAVGVAGLSDLNPKVHHGRIASRLPRAAVPGPAACGAVLTRTGPDGPYSAGQLARAYGIDAAYAAGNLGEGQTVAMYELAPYTKKDIDDFNACYGIAPTIRNINVSGGPFGPSNAEPTLDIQMFASLAPRATILVYQGPNDAVGPIDVFDRIAQDNTASVTSVSWGACESANGTANAEVEGVIFEQMAAQGQSVMAASGDSGSSDCYLQTSDPALSVDDPASQPYVTGVGGTTMTAVGPPPTERVWNDQDPYSGGAGGGGISDVWPRPAWQWGPGTGTGTMRMVPDVSAAADPAYDMVMYMKAYGGWMQVGGTSAASPLLSAAVVLANQGCSTRLGFINPVLYALRVGGVAVTNDITMGSNDLMGVGSYSATPGYDPASGLGSPSSTFLADLCTAGGSVTLSEDHSALASDYQVAFTQGSAPLAAGGTITLAAPAGTAWPAASGAWSISVASGAGVAPATVAVGQGTGSLTANVATLTLAAPIAAGAAVAITATGTINAASAGSQAITITDSTSNPPVLVSYSLVASVPSAASSSVLVSDTEAPADGLGAITVTVTLRDGSGQALIGQPVTLKMQKPSSAVVTPGTDITDANGEASFAITDAVAQATSGTITSAGVTIGSTGTLNFRRTWSADFQVPRNGVAGTPSVATPPAAAGVNVAALAVSPLKRLLVVTNSGGSYLRRDVSALTGSTALVASTPAGVVAGTKLYVAVRSSTGQLLVFSSADLATWSVVNVTTRTGLNVQGDAAIVNAAGTVVVYARGTNGNLLRFSNDASGVTSWQAVNLTSLAGTKLAAASPPVAAMAGDREVVLVRSTKAHLVAFTNASSGPRLWSASDLNLASATATATPNVKLTPAIAVGPGPSYTVYATAITTSGAMLVVANHGAVAKPWVARDYSAAASLPTVGTRISAVVQAGTLRIFARGAGGHVVEALSDLTANPTITGVDLTAQFGLVGFAAGPSAGLGLDGRVYLEGRSSTGQLVAYLRTT